MVRRTLQRWLPTEETLRKHPSLRWLGPILRRPWLWQLSRRRVAAGAAIGVFFGFLIPVMQIACAAAAAVALRANLPMAAAATLVSNPLTYVPIFALAYRTGATLIGGPVDADKAAALAAQLETVDTEKLAEHLDLIDPEPKTRWERVLAIGKPLFLGLAIFAVFGALLTWVVINLLWTLAVTIRRRRALRRGRAEFPG